MSKKITLRGRNLYAVNARPDEEVIVKGEDERVNHIEVKVENVPSSQVINNSYTIESLEESVDYVITTPLEELNITSIVESHYTSSIRFISASTPTTLTYPTSSLYWANEELPEIEANCEYLIAICNNIAVMTKIQTIVP